MMINFNLILLFNLHLLLGPTQYAYITAITTEITTVAYDNICTYGTVYNGNNCDGKINIGV